jgi:hypothetical protein
MPWRLKTPPIRNAAQDVLSEAVEIVCNRYDFGGMARLGAQDGKPAAALVPSQRVRISNAELCSIHHHIVS